jgi:hypothetical protein
MEILEFLRQRKQTNNINPPPHDQSLAKGLLVIFQIIIDGSAIRTFL